MPGFIKPERQASKPDSQLYIRISTTLPFIELVGHRKKQRSIECFYFHVFIINRKFSMIVHFRVTFFSTKTSPEKPFLLLVSIFGTKLFDSTAEDSTRESLVISSKTFSFESL